MLAGAALATSLHQPVLLALGAVALHYLLDALPHWEYAIMTSKKATICKITADIAAGLVIIFFTLQRFTSTEQALMVWGAFFGIVPDGLLAIYLFSHGKYLRLHMQFHTFWHALITPAGTHPPLWLSATTEILVVVASLFLLL